MDGLLRQRSNDFVGIVNGIDDVQNNPETDKRIFANYNKDDFSKKLENKRGLQKMLNLPQSDAPILSLVTRLADQKGLDLIAVCLDELMDKDVQLVVLGTGDGRYENLFKHYAYRFPNKISANIYFDSELAQKIYAGSDIFLMPSMFEPCGLGQLFAMRYGTIPVARKTGGLSDTITHYNFDTMEGTGFLFEDYLASGLMWAINQSLRAYYEKPHFEKLVHNAMSQDFSWKASAQKYIELYKSMI
jgi:starch synthase